MKLTKRQLRLIIREEKQKLDEAVGRRGPVPRQGLGDEDQLIVDEIIELILDRDPQVGTRERALRQLKYYINNMK